MRVLRSFDPWKSPLCTCPLKYSLHPYTGCSHFCTYCYATAYLGRRPSAPKKRFIDALRKDLKKANPKLPVSMSNSSDPYPPIEARLRLTRATLELLISRGFRVLVITKGDIVTRDFDLLAKGGAVSISFSTMDDGLAKRLEPGAPSPSKRIEALRELHKAGVPVAARIDPVIPGLNEGLEELVDRLVEVGVSHITFSTYKARPDNFSRIVESFPEMGRFWKRLYYEEGVSIHGYRYLKEDVRRRLLLPLIRRARINKITYAVCREGLREKEFFNAPSCDGSHLLKAYFLTTSKWSQMC